MNQFDEFNPKDFNPNNCDLQKALKNIDYMFKQNAFRILELEWPTIAGYVKERKLLQEKATSLYTELETYKNVYVNILQSIHLGES